MKLTNVIKKFIEKKQKSSLNTLNFLSIIETYFDSQKLEKIIDEAIKLDFDSSNLIEGLLSTDDPEKFKELYELAKKGTNLLIAVQPIRPLLATEKLRDIKDI